MYKMKFLFSYFPQIRHHVLQQFLFFSVREICKLVYAVIKLIFQSFFCLMAGKHHCQTLTGAGFLKSYSNMGLQEKQSWSQQKRRNSGITLLLQH